MQSVFNILSVATAILASYVITGSAQGQPCSGCSVPASETLCEPTTTFRLVMKPTYVTEMRPVSVQENRSETRYRTKTVYKTVPITEDRFRTKLTSVPKTDTKTITYTVLVPVKSEKSVEVIETVPQWSEEPEEYTVRVPSLVDVPEEYTVKVPQLRDETFTYTINVPQPVTEQKTRTVVNAIPVTKQRTIQVTVPQTEMKTVTKDYGHWEEQIVEIPTAPVATHVSYASLSSGCGCRSACGGGGCRSAAGCGGSSYGGCGGSIGYAAPAVATTGAPVTTTTTKRVWVPNVTTETIPVTTDRQESRVVNYTVYEQQSTQIPYECTTIVYLPETRTGTKQVVNYVDETRIRTRKVVQYNDETRTRMKKTLTFTTVTKTETVPYVTFNTEERTKEISYTFNVPEYSLEPYQTTRYERVAEEMVEEYTVDVPTMVMKQKSVQVCKMVPTLVEETINPCMSGASTGIIGGEIGVGSSVLQGDGCGSPVISAPVMSTPVLNSGCGGCGATISASPCHDGWHPLL